MPKLVMVVEDEPDIARMLETQLTLNGYKVIVAKAGSMSLLTRDFWTWVDIAVIDAMMPFVSGREIMNFLAAAMPRIRRVLCTASLQAIQDYGNLAHAVVVKPYTIQELLKAVGGEDTDEEGNPEE